MCVRGSPIRLRLSRAVPGFEKPSSAPFVILVYLQDFASTRTIFSNKFKLIILDECDAMTKDAQFALRRGAWGG